MITITNKVLKYLENDLSEALIKFSSGKLNSNEANKIACSTIKNIDFENSALAHKGVNWYARQIIDIIDFTKIA